MTVKKATQKTTSAKTTAKAAPAAPKSFDDATAFGQQNVEALVKASELATKAAEGINEEIVSFSKKSFEDSVAAAKDIASSKTATELLEKQTAFAQSAFEDFVAQATKMNDIFTTAAKDITAPIGERVEAATETMKSYTA